jgi:serine/threonine protein kinase
MLRVIRSDVPPGLETVIERCLEKNPKKRYKSVADLAAALGRFGPRKSLTSIDRIRLNFKNASERPFSVSLLPPESDVEPPAAAGTSPPRGTATTRDGDKRARRYTAAALLATTAALGAVGAWLLRVVPRENVPATPVFASQPSHASPASADDPTRAYVMDPGAGVVALAPPTGTGQPAPPRLHQLDSRNAKSLPPRANAEGEPETAPSAVVLPAAPRAVPAKGEGTCLLNLTSTPPSTVLLDGNVIGSSPRVAISVWSGSHTVLFRSAEGREKKTTVTCAPGDTKNIDVKLGDLPPAKGAPSADPAPCPLCDRP